MKHQLKILLSVVGLALVGCSNVPESEELQQFVRTYETSNVGTFTASTLSPCLQMSWCLDVPKSFKFVQDHSDPAHSDELDAGEKEVLDRLALTGAIRMDKVEDKGTFVNIEGHLVSSARYAISMGEAGRAYLVGETGDGYRFRCFDPEQVLIGHIEQRGEDTLSVTYARTLTPVGAVLREVCRSRGHDVIQGDTGVVLLYRHEGDWRL